MKKMMMMTIIAVMIIITINLKTQLKVSNKQVLQLQQLKVNNQHQ